MNINTTVHPYYVKRKGWCSYSPDKTFDKYNLKVNKLKNGDTCYLNENGKLIEIVITSIENIRNLQKCYNFTKVANNNNFFANGILVHNKKN